MRHRNGQLTVTPFVRLASLAMHRLSLHIDGGDPPTIEEGAKTALAGMTPEQFKTALPDVFTKLETGWKASLPKPPEKYEGVKLPEGSMLTAEVLERVAPAARELGLVSTENVQRLVDLMDGEVKGVAQRIAASYSPGGEVFEAQRKQYEAATLAAPDLGNGSPEVMQAKVARVTAFTNKYFPDDVRELINKTGVGNMPNFFRSLLKIADLMKEDGYVGGSTPKPTKSAAERIYGSDKVTA